MKYSNIYGSIIFKLPTQLKVDDVVWIVWNHHRGVDIPESATPTRIVKIYDDGNILHLKAGHDFEEFAWAKDIIAKSPGLPFRHMSYRTVPLKEIREAMYAEHERETNNA
jgi:hypothetical protein